MATHKLQHELEVQVQHWTAVWGRYCPRREELQQQLDEVRVQVVRNEAYTPVTTQQLRKAILATPLQTGMGSDRLKPSFLRGLCPAALEELRNLLCVFEATGLLPWQLTGAVIALLPTPCGGWRPIALMHMLYRLLIRIRRPEITAWDTSIIASGQWDYAGVGLGAEVGA